MDKVLGKGLKAIIKTNSTEEGDRYLQGQIAIDKVIPNKDQPRQLFNDEKMQELIESIKKNGVLQPITVRELDDKQYQIIAGERRYRATKTLGLNWIPAYVITINNDAELMEYALIENIQRVNLNPIEEAEGYAILRGKYNLTQQDIANKVSKSRSEIANKMRLLKLPPIIKQGLRDKKISYGHARALLIVQQSKKMIKLYKQIIENNLSVRTIELKIKNHQKGVKDNRSNIKISDKLIITKLSKPLISYLETKVNTKMNNNKQGTLNIHFSSIKDLERIIKKIKNE